MKSLKCSASRQRLIVFRFETNAFLVPPVCLCHGVFSQTYTPPLIGEAGHKVAEEVVDCLRWI